MLPRVVGRVRRALGGSALGVGEAQRVGEGEVHVERALRVCELEYAGDGGRSGCDELAWERSA